MKEFRGTPGEWTVLAPDREDEDRPRFRWTIRAPGTGICVSFQLAEMSSINRPEDEHDDLLMAAAPELLKALQYALPSLGFEEADKARAAIRKALGE